MMSQSEFSSLYDQYFPKIYRFVYYRVSHKETTEDLVSQIFTKALEKIDKFKSETGNFSAWIYKIAHHTVIDHYRTRHEHQDISEHTELYHEENIIDKMDNKELLNKVARALANLTPEQKNIVIMRVWDELPYEKISEIIGKSTAACKMSFSRSIKYLRATLLLIILIILNV